MKKAMNWEIIQLIDGLVDVSGNRYFLVTVISWYHYSLDTRFLLPVTNQLHQKAVPLMYGWSTPVLRCPKEVGLFCHLVTIFLTTLCTSPKKTHSLDFIHNMLILLIGLSENITDQLYKKQLLPKIFTNAFW
jgi:hypothetical protein